MLSEPTIHDLRSERPGDVAAVALDRVKAVKHGVSVTLILARGTSVLMASLNQQLRGNLAWDIAEVGGVWHVTVRHPTDVEANDVLALLVADHFSINRLMTTAQGLLNKGDAATAAPLLRAFIAALERHVAFEDGELAEILGVAQVQPSAVMLREHREISKQLARLKKQLARQPLDAAELAVHCRILSETLKEHEYREVHNLFPQWRAALQGRNPAARADLLRRAKRALEMP